MSLSAQQVDAFLAIAKHGSFTEAAKILHVTQAALSLRIKNLEEELGATLLIRDPAGLRLTEIGQELLRYGNAKQSMEAEFLSNVKSRNVDELAGVVKIAGLSTIIRPLVLPAISPLLRKHPGIQTELKIGETQDLSNMLRNGSADFIFFSFNLNRIGIESKLLGEELNVMVEPVKGKVPDGVYIDSDEQDATTVAFFKAQGGKLPKWRRQYFDEIYGIVDGVLQGIGRAVVPLHIAKKTPGLRVLDYKPLKIPIYLVWTQQPFYTKLQDEMREALIAGVSEGLRAE